MRPRYLSDLGNDIESALALAAHDLVVTKVMTADAAVAAVRYRADMRRRFLEEANFEEGAGATVVDAVEDLQQDLIEGVWPGPPLVVWPRCPIHENHPLWLRFTNDTDAVWTCPSTQEPVAELGDL